MRGWLTKGDIPDNRIIYELELPDSESWRADFLGAFLTLTKTENWELFESLSPEAMADEWREIFLSFSENLRPVMPPGLISAFAGLTIPDGWLLCDGTEVSRTVYARLFAAIGTLYGNGNGTTTFDLPLLSGRVVVGYFPELPELGDVGDSGGEREHALTTAELAQHTHVQDSHNHTQNTHNHTQSPHVHVDDRQATYGVDTLVANTTAYVLNRNQGNLAGPLSKSSVAAVNVTTVATNIAATATNQNAGSNTAHNNMPPYIILNYVIKI